MLPCLHVSSDASSQAEPLPALHMPLGPNGNGTCQHIYKAGGSIALSLPCSSTTMVPIIITASIHQPARRQTACKSCLPSCNGRAHV